MEILRVETFSKVGAYTAAIPNIISADVNIHPCPEDDDALRSFWNDLNYVRDWYFGFKDYNQLLKWWPKHSWRDFFEHNERNPPENKIVGISTYDVNSMDLRIGDAQVIFIMDRAERLKFRPFQRDNISKKIISVITG